MWPPDTARVGEGVGVTLTWRVLAQTDEPYKLAIHLVGAGDQSYGSVTTYPGHGNAATSVWQPGSIFTDTYWLEVKKEGPVPAHGEIRVNLFNQRDDSTDYVSVQDQQGNTIGDTVTFGSLRIESPSDESPSAAALPIAPDLARFDDYLALTEAQLPDLEQQPGWSVPVLLRWRALQAAPEDVTLSVQLLDEDGAWHAGSDGEPSSELPSPHWRAGDRLHTIRWLNLPPDLPAGRYQVIALLYDANDLSRISAVDGAGQPLADSAWPIAQITVIQP